MTDIHNKTMIASIMHAPVCGEVDICLDALMIINGEGQIVEVVRPNDPSYEKKKSEAKQDNSLVQLPSNQFLLPGFVDLHIHAPQWPQLGKALDVPLEVWLMEHTFPLEARYSDEKFAERMYADLVGSLLANGTTTALYFATIHKKATQLLADICLEKGQRALIGKVVMDNPDQCPDYYRDKSTETALEETESFINYVHSMKNNTADLVKPVITPRFIPSCTDEALSGLGKLAQTHHCHVQTHCSESDWEHNYVLDRTGKTDTNALADFGLIGRHTILAHSNFISDQDMDVIADKGAGIAHCPLSNIYFSTAIFPLKRALEKSLRVGLGTDISGGPSASIFETCRFSIHMSRTLEEGTDASLPADERGIENSRINFREAFHLATAGGADALDLPVGRFEAGYQFDAILVAPDAPASPIFIDDELDTLDDQLQKIIYSATRANILSTWVSGRNVFTGKS
jgi:guanine deaminase